MVGGLLCVDGVVNHGCTGADKPVRRRAVPIGIAAVAAAGGLLGQELGALVVCAAMI